MQNILIATLLFAIVVGITAAGISVSHNTRPDRRFNNWYDNDEHYYYDITGDYQHNQGPPNAFSFIACIGLVVIGGVLIVMLLALVA